MATLCAVVDAIDADAIKRLITSAGWSPHSWRTMESKPPGWMPPDLPRATPTPATEQQAGERVCIVGGPRTGKTTMANSYGLPVRHTDDLITSHEWSEVSDEVSTWFDKEGPWCIEGVATARGARKWIQRHHTGRPFDTLVILTRPHIELSPGQTSMMKGVETVLKEVVPSLRLRGVAILKGA